MCVGGGSERKSTKNARRTHSNELHTCSHIENVIPAKRMVFAVKAVCSWDSVFERTPSSVDKCTLNIFVGTKVHLCGRSLKDICSQQNNNQTQNRKRVF